MSEEMFVPYVCDLCGDDFEAEDPVFLDTEFIAVVHKGCRKEWEETHAKFKQARYRNRL